MQASHLFSWTIVRSRQEGLSSLLLVIVGVGIVLHRENKDVCCSHSSCLGARIAIDLWTCEMRDVKSTPVDGTIGTHSFPFACTHTGRSVWSLPMPFGRVDAAKSEDSVSPHFSMRLRFCPSHSRVCAVVQSPVTLVRPCQPFSNCSMEQF